MSIEQLNGVGAGYRKVGVFLLVGLVGIGVTRLEDRAIIGAPRPSASAMAAIGIADSDPEREGLNAEPSGASVAMTNASRLPSRRVRRILNDRDVPTAAARQILAPAESQDLASPAAEQSAAASAPAIQAFTPVDPAPPTFASLAPPLSRQGTPIFAANIPSGDNGGGGTGGGAGGNGGNNGGGDGVTPPPPPPPPGPVSPVPEPGSWVMLILGLFGTGAALRRRVPADSTFSPHTS